MVDVAEKWFGNSPNAQLVSITTFLSSPMQPMVFNSLMNPIAVQWGKQSVSSGTRESFYDWRRARPLPEYIPAAPQIIESMIRGWILADIFGQIKHERDQNLGAKIELWDPAFGHVSFPYPLLHPGTPTPAEYLGAVLESLSLAIVLCSQSHNNPLEPLRAYHRLMDLGGSSSSTASIELQNWISTGSLPSGAPTTLSDAGATSHSRAEYLSQRLVEKMNSASTQKQRVDEKGDPYLTNPAWEIHRLRLKAVEQLQALLSGIGEDEEM